MKYRIIKNGVDELNNEGKGYDFNEARTLARKLRNEGVRAEVINMRSVKGVMIDEH